MHEAVPFRVLVLVDCTTGEGRDALTSVIQSLIKRPHWRIRLPPGPGSDEVLQGRHVADLLHEADAAIIRLYDDVLMGRVAAMKKPTVSLVHRSAFELGLPTVTTSGPLMTELAVDHLAERQFHHVGYVGFASLGWHVNRCEAAKAAVKRHGCTFWPFLADADQPYTLVASRAFRRWLEDLPKPVGIVTADDRIGFQLLEACADAGLRVPRDVAVIGAGNDATICEAASVPLSSVDAGMARVGEAACEVLDRLLMEKPIDLESYLPPLGVVRRSSTDVIATGDDVVAEALQRIRSHAAAGLTADALAAGLPLSRSSFERRFRTAIGRSPMREIQRVRIEEAKRLLINSDLTLDAVTRRSGFTSPQRFYAVFKESTGLTPRLFRLRAGDRPSSL